jgi:hypothetical protein
MPKVFRKLKKLYWAYEELNFQKCMPTSTRLEKMMAGAAGVLKIRQFAALFFTWFIP